MRILMIAIGALIVLGGGAFGAYFYFFNPAEASLTEDLDAEEHAEKDSSYEPFYYEYVELDPLILPIVDENGVSQTVSMVIALEVDSASTKSKIQAIQPRLKDAFIQDMYGVINRHAALKGGVLQVDILKKRLFRVSEKVVGEDKVNDVLLQVVQQRPI